MKCYIASDPPLQTHRYKALAVCLVLLLREAKASKVKERDMAGHNVKEISTALRKDEFPNNTRQQDLQVPVKKTQETGT